MTDPSHENPYAALPEPRTSALAPAVAVATEPRRFHALAVAVGLAVDVGVLFGVVLIVACIAVDPSTLGPDAAVAFVETFARPPVRVMLFAGLFVGHAGGGFVTGRLAGGRAGWHGLALALAFTLLTTLLALGADELPTAPIPDWLNGLELVARAPLAIVGCHVGALRWRSRQL